MPAPLLAAAVRLGARYLAKEVVASAIGKNFIKSKLFRRALQRRLRKKLSPGQIRKRLSKTARRGRNKRGSRMESPEKPPDRIIRMQPTGDGTFDYPRGGEMMPYQKPTFRVPSSSSGGSIDWSHESPQSSGRVTDEHVFAKDKGTPELDNKQPAKPVPEKEKKDLFDYWGNKAFNYDNMKRALAGLWPKQQWHCHVSAYANKTTPMRTAVHYCLAVAFGLIKSNRLGGMFIKIEIDYEINLVQVTLGMQSSLITDVVTAPTTIAKVIGSAISGPPEQGMDTSSGRFWGSLRSAARGIGPWLPGSGIYYGVAALTSGGGLPPQEQPPAPNGGAPTTKLQDIYNNISRELGPLSIYDMGDETIYGGTPTTLTSYVGGVKPFADISKDAQGRPAILLTRYPAPNPQPPGPPNLPPAYGYSTDLRSLVTQALVDPGMTPPFPQTNVILPVVGKF